MVAARNATPLISLDAVVIDTETTGLDPAKARIVEVAAVRLIGGHISSEKTFRRLVRPDVPIPETATAIHHIDAAQVADAPSFREIWPDFSHFTGTAIVIGHTLGFDLTVLTRECARAGIEYARPRTLDTRLLAEVAEPDLSGFTLEELANWLGVEISGRHSALGDAMTTARIFLALVPRLRERGIRTLGEALHACHTLTEALHAHRQTSWAETAAPGWTDTERAFSRIDTYPYRHRVRDVMSTHPKSIASDKSLGEALTRLVGEGISSLYVRRPDAGEHKLLARHAGIVTEHDVLRGLAAHGGSALDMPVDTFASRPLVAVTADEFIYRAIGRMSRLKIRHLCVTDEAGLIVGALSARDLLRLRAGEAMSLGDEIDQAVDVQGLGTAWAKLPHVAASLLIENVSGRDIAAVISSELSAFTGRAAVIAEKRMRDEGRGSAPCPYAVAVLGSAGRGESLLAMDQDNAIVFAEGEPGGKEDRWFEALGTHLADILHEVGVPYCKGGVMAKNSQWRGSLITWKTRIADWIQRSQPEDLLSVDIFFDLYGVHGEASLAETLWRYGFDMAKGEIGFAKLLVGAAGAIEPGLGFFGGFKTNEGRINLKKAGLFGVVTTARALAIHHHIVERSTPARLEGMKAIEPDAETDLDALINAQGVFLDLILDQQIDDIEHGRPATNAVLVKRLKHNDRDELRTALEAVRHLDDFAEELLFKA